jgi:hypothetical protein
MYFGTIKILFIEKGYVVQIRDTLCTTTKQRCGFFSVHRINLVVLFPLFCYPTMSFILLLAIQICNRKFKTFFNVISSDVKVCVKKFFVLFYLPFVVCNFVALLVTANKKRKMEKKIK